jgi:hypothetical protein
LKLIGKGHSQIFSCVHNSLYDNKTVCVKVTDRREEKQFLSEYKVGKFFRKYAKFIDL